MEDRGEAVLIALADQGFGLRIDEELTVIVSRDGRRHHEVETDIFWRNDQRSQLKLRMLVYGLEFIEDFTPPPGMFD